MKLITKAFLIILSLNFIFSATVLRHKSSKGVSKPKLRNKEYEVVRPIKNLQRVPNFRRYRKPSQVFGTGVKAELFREVGAVDMTKRECNILCQDRISERCSKGVVAKAAADGTVECVCNKAKSAKVFPQMDYCYNVQGCFAKSTFQTCHK